MLMHISPGQDGTPPRLLSCSSPSGCPYRKEGALPVGVPHVHGDAQFMNDVMEYTAGVNSEIAKVTQEYAMRGETMDTPEFRQWLMGKLAEKTNPPTRRMGGVGFPNDDPWAPWTANGVTPSQYDSIAARDALRDMYPEASDKWIREKIALETRKQPVIADYGNGDAYTLDYDFQSRTEAIPGTPQEDKRMHDAYIYTRDPFIQNNNGGVLNLDPNEHHLFIADYESNPPRMGAVRYDPDNLDLLGLPVEHIQGYRGARPYYTPVLEDNPKDANGNSNYPDYDMPAAVLSAPLIRKDAERKDRAWANYRRAGESVTGNSYRNGAFEMSGGYYNPNSGTVTTDTLRINDQNGDYIKTPHIYSPIFNRNAYVMNIKNSYQANLFADRFVEYDEEEDTYSIDWKRLHDAGIDMLVFDECKEGWDNYMDVRNQRGFTWDALDHSMQSYIINGSAICGWVKYDTGMRYAPYSGARGGGH